jgi:hypothetical protein
MVRDQPDEGRILNVNQGRGTVLGDDWRKIKRKPPKFWVVFLYRFKLLFKSHRRPYLYLKGWVCIR